MGGAEPGGFGPLLRRLRTAAGLTQEALAERAGLSARGVQDLERGVRHSPHAETTRRLAGALGLSRAERAALRRAGHARAASGDSPGTSRPPGLPVPLTSFIGRGPELAELQRLLGGTRLLTLTGAGGVGKTRLALEGARRLAGEYPDGVWLVELAALTDSGSVPQAVADVFGVREQPGRALRETLLAALRNRRLLLVLDNCEHLVQACAELAEALLRTCPELHVLAASREPLRVPGETTWRVPSLDLPPPAAAPAALAASGAGRLFLDRARAVQPAFRLTDANAPGVAQVCARLDGIPLALELAAARVRVLSVEQIAARLDDRFRLLAGGGRTSVRRHQTLRAALDWSHDLLSAPERALFRRLAVFAGGFALEAAETVCAGGPGAPVAADAVLDLLTGLVDKSLVLAEPRGAEARYRLLESLRQYAEERLRQAGEAGAVRERHLAWCLGLSRAVADAVAAGAHPAANPALERLRGELENVRGALTWCAADPAAAPAGLQLLANVGYGDVVALLWGVGETAGEVRRWLETFLGRAPARTAPRARGLLALDFLLRAHHEFAAAGRAAREAREIFEELDDEDGVAHATSREGLVAANFGDYERGAALLGAALARARERGDWARVEGYARDLGVIALLRRDFATARARLEESRALLERHGLGPLRAVALLVDIRLALLDRLEGDYARARARLAALGRHTALDAAGPGGQVELLASYRSLALGNLARAEGRYDEARARIHGTLRRIRQRGEGVFLPLAVCTAGMLEIARGAPARGVALIAAGARGGGPIGTIHVPDARAEVPGFLARARQTLGEAGYAAAWAAGQAISPEQAVAYALEDAPATA
jgi:non-specific serine/threonine protein kinase